MHIRQILFSQGVYTLVGETISHPQILRGSMQGSSESPLLYNYKLLELYNDKLCPLRRLSLIQKWYFLSIPVTVSIASGRKKDPLQSSSFPSTCIWKCSTYPCLPNAERYIHSSRAGKCRTQEGREWTYTFLLCIMICTFYCSLSCSIMNPSKTSSTDAFPTFLL